ncbi:MAG: Zn-dependent alcohol dehydrogenase [Chloroflexi bacterium]|nr:Zn-dependent alcohol dehydrogenase [Chloroflexota bacterium]
MKTHAAVTYQPGQPLVIEPLELDEPHAGEVRVKLAAVGLCHSDHHVMAGKRPVGMRPMVLGHEGAGVVEAVGPGVTRVRPGDHVVLTFIPSCGHCRYCQSGLTSACVLGPKIAAGPLPDGTYRLLGCGVVGGFNAAVTRARVRPGSSALVIGVGGVGMNVIQGARAASASTIIAADLGPRKLECARDFGATHTIDASREEVVGRVLEITGGAGVDCAFEAISGPETIAQAFAATAKLGTVVVVGLTPATVDSLPISPLQLVLGQKTLMGTLYGTSNAQVEIPKLLHMYAHGQIKLDELITARYALDQINQGYDDMLAGKNIRGVLVF